MSIKKQVVKAADDSAQTGGVVAFCIDNYYYRGYYIFEFEPILESPVMMLDAEGCRLSTFEKLLRRG